MYGHVNNTKVFAYFEYARIEYFKALGFDFTAGSDTGNMLVVADIQCDYLKEVFFDEELDSICKNGVDRHFFNGFALFGEK